jgi:hypothetical protein
LQDGEDDGCVSHNADPAWFWIPWMSVSLMCIYNCRKQYLIASR